MVKDKTLGVLIKELDGVFSEFIRLRDADEHGTVTCFVTGERVFWRDTDAAHWIHRKEMATRYDEMNVHATTITSNRFDFDHDDQYWLAMVRTYPLNEIQALKKRSYSLAKWTRAELLEKIEFYKSEVIKLKQKL